MIPLLLCVCVVSGCQQTVALLLDSSQSGVAGGACSCDGRLRVSHKQNLHLQPHRRSTSRLSSIQRHFRNSISLTSTATYSLNVQFLPWEYTFRNLQRLFLIIFMHKICLVLKETHICLLHNPNHKKEFDSCSV